MEDYQEFHSPEENEATELDAYSLPEKEFLKAVNETWVSSSHPEYLTGYTGKRISMLKKSVNVDELGSGSHSPSKSASISYSALKSQLNEVHNNGEKKWGVGVQNVPVYDHSIEENYRNAVIESNRRGQTVERMLKEIATKFNLKFRSLSEKTMRIKSVFEYNDEKKTGIISTDNFQLSCEQLNIVLPREEFTALISYFDEQKSGMISYRPFINIICPGTYQ